MAKTKYNGVYVDNKGNYYIETELGTDRITGKRLRKKSRKDEFGQPYPSAAAAYKDLIRVKNEYHGTNGYANYEITYGQYFDKVFLPAYRTEVEETSLDSRRCAIKLIKARFEQVKLREITVDQVDAFRTWLMSDIEHGGNGYAQNYAAMVYAFFSSTLENAVRLRFLTHNVCDRLKPIPKGRVVVAFWTKEEFQQVLEVMDPTDVKQHLYYTMFWTYFMTGLRVNECTALWWENIDFEKKLLHVDFNLHYKKDRASERVNYLKTEAGQRIITLDDDTLAVLREWRKRQLDHGLGGDKDFVFSLTGYPIGRWTIGRWLRIYADKAGVHRIQAKGLRHSHVSYLINEFNVSVLILSKRVGHSSPDITLKHYAHLWHGMDASIAEAMTGSLQRQAIVTTGSATAPPSEA